MTTDERLVRKYSDGHEYANATRTEKSLVCIHHTDILKGMEYWQEAAEKLATDFPARR